MASYNFQTSAGAPPKIDLAAGLQEFAKNRRAAEAVDREEALQRDKLAATTAQQDRANKLAVEQLAATTAHQKRADVLADKQLQISRDQLAESKSQNQITNEIRKAEEARRAKQATENERLARIAEADREVLGNLEVSDIKYGPHVSQEVAKARNNVANLEQVRSKNIELLNTRRTLINDEGMFSPEGQKEFANRVKLYGSILPKEQAEAKAREDIQGIVTAARANNYEQASQELIDQAKADILSSYNTIPATQEEYIKQGMAQLSSSGYSAPRSNETRKALAERAKLLGLKSEAEYSADALAQNKAALEKRKTDIEFKKDYYTLVNKKIDSKGGMGEKEWAEFVNGLDAFGDKDKRGAQELFVALRKSSNVPSEYIQKAIAMSTISTFGWDTEARDATNADHLKYVGTLAQRLAAGTPDHQIAASEFELGRIPTVSKEDLLKRRFTPVDIKSIASRLNLNPASVPLPSRTLLEQLRKERETKDPAANWLRNRNTKQTEEQAAQTADITKYRRRPLF